MKRRRGEGTAVPNMFTLRLVGLAALATDAALVVGLTAKGSVLARPGGPRYVFAVLAALAVYAAVGVVLTASTGSWVVSAVRVGVAFGAVTGGMWTLNLLVETFGGLSGWRNILATAPLLLGGFALWGVAGGWAHRRAGRFAGGVLAAVTAAMSCVAITLVAGFALPFLALSRLADNINGSPEYLHSGWHDLPAFAIANTLDAGFTHLLIAPIIAAFVGTLGAMAIATTSRHPEFTS